MKIYVYTISKNESANVSGFMENMRDADGIYVMDTGSTDDTVNLLKKAGAVVSVKKYKNFRFDKARNDALKMLPDDDGICVCPDLDERFEPGWRQQLEKAWTTETERARYHYVWSINPDGSDGVSFTTDKIHSRHGFKWVHPVHETLVKTNGENPVFVNTEVVLKHYPDAQKPRSAYLPLLELACRESPDDDRSAHYLGREYMFYKRYLDAIREFKRHLSLKTAVWADERCASYRYIAKCYAALGNQSDSESALLHAVAEAPHLREPLFDLSEMLYAKSDWKGVLYFMGKAVSLSKNENYITDPRCYGALPYDYLSMAAYLSGDLTAAAYYAQTALTYGDNERIKQNLEQHFTK